MKYLALFWGCLLSISCTSQPNVLLIYVDDLGYGDLGCYGHPVIQTPILDQLASEGVKLTNYYAPSPLCSPSRAALLTGRHPYRTGIQSWIPGDSGIFLHRDEETIAEILQGAGYATALIGKWHLNSDLGNTAEPQPSDHGFDYAYGHNAFQIPTNYRPTNIFRNGKRLPVQSGYTAQLYADEAITWLQNRNTNQPFFLFLSMAEPHTTFENPPEYNEMYADYTQGEILAIPSGEEEIPVDKLIARGPGEYYANITYMDAQLGRVLEALKAQSLDQSTVVIFASDNGPVTEAWRTWWEVNAHGSTGGLRGRKHQLYEGGIKVPALVRYPVLFEPGTTSHEVITGTDLFHTILHLTQTHAPTDRSFDGINASKGLQGMPLPERPLFWSLPTDIGIDHAVRLGRWKLLVDREGKSRQLFDLHTDPLELIDRINDTPEKAAELHELWKDHQRAIEKDPLRPPRQ